VVQLADQGNAFVGANLGGPQIFAPNVGVERNVLGQWNVDPTIEADELELLQIAYRKGVDPLDADGSIRRDAYQKICELVSDYHIVPTRDVAFDMIEALGHDVSGHQAERLARLRGELDALYAEIDELSLQRAPYEPEKFFVGGGEVPTKLDFLKEQASRLLHEVCHGNVEQIRAFHRPGRNVGLVEQAQDKIEALLALVDESPEGPPNPFGLPWLCQGCRDDVPECACLVGCYRGCGCERYVWVAPDKLGQFRDFVLIVLALAPPTAQDVAPTQAGLGAANNPNF
jgi:hypothetical protein